MAFEWSDGAAGFFHRWQTAAELTEDANGAWVIMPGLIGWRVTSAPGSGYPTARTLTLAGLWRRLAAAPPGAGTTQPRRPNTQSGSLQPGD